MAKELGQTGTRLTPADKAEHVKRQRHPRLRPQSGMVSVHKAFWFFPSLLSFPPYSYASQTLLPPHSPLTIFRISFLQPSLLSLPPQALLLMCSWQLWLRESRRFYPMCHWSSSRETWVWERVASHRKTGTQEKWVVRGKGEQGTRSPLFSSLLPSQDWLRRLDHHQFA